MRLLIVFSSFSVDLISQMKDVGDVVNEFFQLPTETKQQYAYGGKEMHGWMAFGAEM